MANFGLQKEAELYQGNKFLMEKVFKKIFLGVIHMLLLGVNCIFNINLMNIINKKYSPSSKN